MGTEVEGSTSANGGDLDANQTLSQLTRLAPGPGAETTGCDWLLGALSSGDSGEMAAAALLLADSYMKMRCGLSPAYALWKAHASGTTPKPNESDRRRIEPFIQDAFGLPERVLPDNQVEGYVAQLIWHRITGETLTSRDGLRRLAHLEDVGSSVLEPGGDGLAVYESSDGQLVFRLWEIKKHVSAQHVSSTIARACDQLSGRGAAYLAKLTGIGKGYPEPLGRLFATLVDLWIDADERAGLGISIATSEGHTPKKSGFGGVAHRFPRFSGVAQREGLLTAIGDFPVFARVVRDMVWSGL